MNKFNLSEVIRIEEMMNKNDAIFSGRELLICKYICKYRQKRREILEGKTLLRKIVNI